MKPRKKYNPHKRHKRLAEIALKNLCLVWCNGNTEIWPYNYSTLEKIPVGNSVVNALDKVRYNWTVHCAVFMREKNGKEKIKLADISAPYECFHYQLVDSLNAEHKAFIESFDNIKDLICGVGWVAVPRSIELSEQVLNDLFRKNGAFSYLAKWQE